MSCSVSIDRLMKRAALFFAILASVSLPLYAVAEDEAQSDALESEQEEVFVKAEGESNPYRSMTDFVRALTIIKNNYVDGDKVTYDKMLEAALKGLLQNLDPFSTYEEPERYKLTREDSSGQFAGIGTTITGKNGFYEIVSVIPDGPASKAGMKAGDILVEVDSEPTEKMDMESLVRRLKGEPGTSVTVKVYRRSADKDFEFAIERAVIPVTTVRGMRVLDNDIGYIQVTQFSATTAVDLDKAIDELKKKGIESLILDLRSNPGGLLESAIEVCSRFIRSGEPVVSIEGRDPKDTARYAAIDSVKTLDMPLAILINGNSASASEIFSACMQDHKRAILIGEKSFGKGSVQTIIPFGKGAIRMTTAKYYTPSRKPIHGHGVEPDIRVGLSPAHDAALRQQLTMYPGELKPMIPNPVRDPQLERALEILKGVRLFQQVKNND